MIVKTEVILKIIKANKFLNFSIMPTLLFIVLKLNPFFKSKLLSNQALQVLVILVGSNNNLHSFDRINSNLSVVLLTWKL